MGNTIVSKRRSGVALTEAVVAHICEQLVLGRSLRSICLDDEGMPALGSVMRWLDADAAFRERYARARELQADTLVDEILEIADDGRYDTYVDDQGNTRTDHEAIARARLRIDARKWVAAKMRPRKYGDRLTLEPVDDRCEHAQIAAVDLSSIKRALERVRGGQQG
ncbi:MAG: terminase small subunit protein [Burkholderiaceae bacterium]|nr:terminase small subunit protein [Burkholderiaceae bacterium]